MKFEGKRVYLRPMTEADATEAYASWLNDPEVNKYLATKSATIEELKNYIREKNNKKDCLLLGLFLKENDKHIGTLKLEPIDFVAEVATIGIMIGEREEWGKGYAGEAMQLLIDYCFKDLRLREIKLGVIGENTSAIHAYEKLGFKEVTREPGAVLYENGRFDQVTMVLKNNAN